MRILFRVDAGPEAGSGHFMRCRLLARALRRRGAQPGFFTSTPDNDLLGEAREEGFPMMPLADDAAVDASAIADAATANGAEVLVVDDHRSEFHTRSFQRTVRQAGLRLMMISFQHDVHFEADAVLNQNLLALERDYSAEAHTDLLLGPRYAILDERYQRLRPDRLQVPDEVGTVLLTFGGADRTRQTPRVVDALTQMTSPPQHVIVVVGNMYDQPDALGASLDAVSTFDTDLYVNTPQMPKLMAQADLAVSSGGLTAWELACLGVPNVILSTADAERETGELLAQKEYAAYLGHHDETDPPDIVRLLDEIAADSARRQRLARRSWELVDGRGTDRVVDYIGSL